jgi:transposase
MSQRQIMLTSSQRQELIRLRDTADKPYLRERAAAILKVADGTPAAVVARQGLLRQRKPDTIYDWLNRFHDEGVAGLNIRPGRGRKPAFSAETHRASHTTRSGGRVREVGASHSSS